MEKYRENGANLKQGARMRSSARVIDKSIERESSERMRFFGHKNND